MGGEGGRPSYFYYETKEKALAVRRAMERQFKTEGTTVATAIDLYEKHLKTKENRKSSIATTLSRLHSFFDDEFEELAEVTQARGERRYRVLAEESATDTHRNTLAESKTFLRWCVKQGWLPTNPLAKVEPVGRRRRGKPQLRIDEARQWVAEAIREAETGVGEAHGAVAALMTVLLGLRCGEIVALRVRDVDDEARVVWVAESKTEAGVRRVEVPEGLRRVLARIGQGRGGDELLFGKHWRDWPRHCVQRICRKAGVPVVSAHGMRGLHATLATEAGVTSHVVAANLGHASPRTTEKHYAAPGARRAAVSRKVALTVIDGGRP